MGKIIAIHSFRGGTGKSNVTASLAALLAGAGKRIGVIDTDIHSPGIHVIFGLNVNQVRHSLNDYLWGRCKVGDAAHDVTAALGEVALAQPRTRIFLIPSSVKPGEISRILREGYDIGLLTDGLRELIATLDLDLLLIDTHPGVNEETLLSIAIADFVLLIMRPDNQDFQGTAVTVELARQLDVASLQLLINKVPPGVDWDRLRVQAESAFRAPVIGMLPLDADMARLASESIFAVRHPTHSITQGLAQVAARMLG
ncbi:MinD/ParA family ATP-binding protein [Aquisphaera insulae]|uniref:MinD/ParA family ATP-binding protein n=1 Tax=Aquisphaera insulae TaxID=2712864 RepID=UPI0013ED2502|nr:MinD/ParA family protein [Aquisphaera insulae]